MWIEFIDLKTRTLKSRQVVVAALAFKLAGWVPIWCAARHANYTALTWVENEMVWFSDYIGASNNEEEEVQKLRPSTGTLPLAQRTRQNLIWWFERAMQDQNMKAYMVLVVLKFRCLTSINLIFLLSISKWVLSLIIM